MLPAFQDDVKRSSSVIVSVHSGAMLGPRAEHGCRLNLCGMRMGGTKNEIYRDTVALRVNPFRPSFLASPENRMHNAWLTNLDRLPLRLDQYAGVFQPLFCNGILDL